MKLKTNFQDEAFKLGEVTNVDIATMPDGRIKAQAIAKVGGIHTFFYDDLETFIKDWEDYEENEYYYAITSIKADNGITKMKNIHNDMTAFDKSIGNYFSSREEAEKAVEKLKAWKRLKDKGFRFDIVPALGHCDDEKFDVSILATMPAKWWYNDKVVDDIHYVFGGEE